MTETVSFDVPLEAIKPYLGDWHECTAIRFLRNGDQITFQVSYQPPCPTCTAKGYVVQVGPGHQEARITCPSCEGTGRQPAPEEQP